MAATTSAESSPAPTDPTVAAFVDRWQRSGAAERAEAGTVTKASGDGGIDGVINEDRLGLDAVYVQAKRWEDNVGVKALREFVGSLSAHKAHKGVFITTSDYAAGAKEYVSQVSQKIVLINGTRLAELMIDFGVGVSVKQSYEVKRADEDYFAEA